MVEAKHMPWQVLPLHYQKELKTLESAGKKLGGSEPLLAAASPLLAT